MLALKSLTILTLCSAFALYATQAEAQMPVEDSLGPAYSVNGVTYTPRFDPNFDSTGTASWYGEKFHGKMTASLEKFDKNALTAAHKTLPLGSQILVTNLSNGKTVTVRINDRGPFHGGHEIDLSEAAAKIIGTDNGDKSFVRISLPQAKPMRDLPPIPTSPAAEAKKKSGVRTITIKGKLVAAAWSAQ